MASGRQLPIDVLVLTAADGEDTALRAVDDGAVGEWQTEPLPGDDELSYRVRDYRSASGPILRVAHVHTGAMGETKAAIVATRYISDLKPRVLAMCGVCAGRPGWCGLGEVVVAEQIYKYDAGELVRVTADQEPEFLADAGKRGLSGKWHNRVLDFGQQFAESELGRELLARRPLTMQQAELRLLDALDRGEDANTALPDHFPSAAFATLVDGLRERKLLSKAKGSLRLLSCGRDAIADVRLRHRDQLPTERAWKLHTAPFATGSTLRRDVTVWDQMKHSGRLVHALDMEGAAVAEAGWQAGIEPTLIVKAVMDFAEPDRRQFARAFAAEASARVLLALLREKLEPAAADAASVLQPGFEERPAAMTNPGSLLHPRFQAIEFFDEPRARELRELREWCADDDLLRARLLVGPGGTGKTRLLIEWTQRLRNEGWAAGFLPPDPDDDQLDRVFESGGPTCIVIDYAETRSSLARILTRATVRRATGKLRIVLLAREVADWWKQLLSDPAIETLLATNKPTAITPLPIEGELRQALFRSATKAFALIIGVAEPTPKINLDEPRFARALYVAMAALAAVSGETIRAERVLTDTVRRERNFWLYRFHEQIPDDDLARQAFGDAMARFLAAVTLRGGVPRGPIAQGLRSRVRGPDTEHLLEGTARIYPGFDAEKARVVNIAPVEPDLLGEQLVHEVLQHHDTPEGFLDQVFEDATPNDLSNGFVVLGRLAIREHESGVAGVWIDRLISDDPIVKARPAIDATLSLGAETAHVPIARKLAGHLERTDGDEELAAWIEGLLSQQPSVSLRELRVWATQRLFDGLRGATSESDRQERARLANNLGAMLSELGRREDALAAADEAVQIYRQLAELRPDAFLPYLAGSLNNLGATLSELGRREDALAAADKAVQIYRQLAELRPDAFLPDLAMSLNNLGAMLSELGRREDALAAADEAVQIYRQLAELRPDAFLPDLAASLNNLGIRLSELGRREDALAAADEAVQIYRQLAELRPDAFLPDLAMSLNNLGIRLSELGRREDALAAADEAVQIYRQLAELRPDAFLPDLAASLNNLGNRLSELGRREDALAAADEAVQIYRQLAELRPDAFLPDLAASLNNLGNRLSELGRREDALAAADEAVQIRRQLAELRPDAFLPDLAMSLNNLGNRLSELGRREDALAAADEAVQIYRQLAELRPDAFLPDLAMSLNNLGNRLSELGRREDALAAADEAVQIRRQLSERRGRIEGDRGDEGDADSDAESAS